MAALELFVNGVRLPEGVVQFERGDEILWGDNTGRAADSGVMVGSVIATKSTYTISWGVITQDEYASILALIPAGFFHFTAVASGVSIANIGAYRSNVTGEYIGQHGGRGYWKGVSVQIIER